MSLVISEYRENGDIREVLIHYFVYIVYISSIGFFRGAPHLVTDDVAGKVDQIYIWLKSKTL